MQIAVDHAVTGPCARQSIAKDGSNVRPKREQLARLTLVCLTAREREPIVDRPIAPQLLTDAMRILGIVDELQMREHGHKRRMATNGARPSMPGQRASGCGIDVNANTFPRDIG